jgi:FlaA1/EpsC-like NDP-sugar epimerase
LAKNLLHLAGLDNRDGRRIVYTGLRPGERLHEQLLAPDEQTRATTIPKVRLVLTNGDCGEALSMRLVDWVTAFRDGDDARVVAALIELFPGLRGSHAFVQKQVALEDAITPQ